MTVWRPKPFIRVKVLGLVWRGDQLLAAEIEDSSGRVTGVRPLGGSIEFGETREAALEREFLEELGCTTRITGPWHSFENIFEHEGNIGHEFVFAANIELDNTGIYERETIRYNEDDGLSCTAAWFLPAGLPSGVDLYPSGLLTEITRRGIAA